jgi:hypothetical protein
MSTRSIEHLVRAGLDPRGGMSLMTRPRHHKIPVDQRLASMPGKPSLRTARETKPPEAVSAQDVTAADGDDLQVGCGGSATALISRRR